MILAGTIFIGVMNIRASLDFEFSSVFKKYYDWEVALGLDGNYPVRGVEARTLNIQGVTGVESQTQTRVQRVAADGTRGYAFNIVGVSPDTDFMRPDIESGRWLQTGDRNALVATTSLLKDMPDVNLGDKITLRVNNQNQVWEIVGIIPQAWDKSAYADFNYLSRTLGTAGETSSLYLRTAGKDGNAQAAMAETVEA